MRNVETHSIAAAAGYPDCFVDWGQKKKKGPHSRLHPGGHTTTKAERDPATESCDGFYGHPWSKEALTVWAGAKQIGGSGGSLDPPGLRGHVSPFLFFISYSLIMRMVVW
jgi:hypothetical protein